MYLGRARVLVIGNKRENLLFVSRAQRNMCEKKDRVREENLKSEGASIIFEMYLCKNLVMNVETAFYQFCCIHIEQREHGDLIFFWFTSNGPPNSLFCLCGNVATGFVQLSWKRNFSQDFLFRMFREMFHEICHIEAVELRNLDLICVRLDLSLEDFSMLSWLLAWAYPIA